MRRIFLTIVLSTVAHVAVVLWLDVDFRGFKRERPAALQIVLQTEQEPVQAEADPLPLLEPETQPEPDSEPDPEPESVTEEEIAEAEIPTEAVPTPIAPNVRQRLITSIRQSDSTAAFLIFQQAECTERESHSERKRCNEPATGDPRAGFYAVLFRQAMSHVTQVTPTIAKQLDQVDGLMREMDTLAALDAEDPVQKAMIREQQRHLQSEINRIDRGLASVNLLRLIPMVRKAAKGLKNVGEE